MRNDKITCSKYPVKRINSMKDEFRGRSLSAKDCTIYYDLDNTLALFSIKGEEDKALKNMNKEGFYKNLEMLDDGVKVIPVLRNLGFNVKILSACIDTPYCRPEKIEWVKKYIPNFPVEDIILCNVGDSKTDYVEDISKAILIDDFHENLVDWIDKGGFAVKKTYSNKPRNIDVIHNHVEIFEILQDLRLLG